MAAATTPPMAAGRDRPLEVPTTVEAVVVDGRLDEAAWATALSIPLHWETNPGDNSPAPVATECLITFDADRLYVAFRAHDPDPQKIRARFTDRDTVFQDDFVGVILDTFNDERRAFQFFVNPRGVQADVFLDQVNDNEDSSWDAIWDAAARIHEGGYVAEMAIPFSSLRFPRTTGPQVWGLDALRYWPRSSRHRLTSVPRDRANECHLCQLSKIVGFENVNPGRNVEITPTLTGSRRDRRQSGGGLEAGDGETDAGLTARWGMTPNLILSGTVNPDFSQVEADAAQLGVNEQFTLFFPERRPFFLEGADFFDTPFRAVFTRNVADPDWGLKFTGKEGANAYGAFVAQDSQTNLLLPGSQGSRVTSLETESTDVALRYRRDVGSSAALGALFTSRDGGGYENQVFGVDGLFRPSPSDTIRFQVLGSRSHLPSVFAGEEEQPEGSFSGHALAARYIHQSRQWRYWGTYDDVAEDFRADLGFMPQVDFRRGVAGTQRTWWGDEGTFYNRINWGGDWDLTEDQKGRELEQEVETYVDLFARRESQVSAGGGTRRRFFGGRQFEEVFGWVYGQVQALPDLNLVLEVYQGDGIDLANVQAGRELRIQPSLRWDAGKHLRLNLRHDALSLDVDAGRLFEARLTELRAAYQLNLRTFLRVIGQYTEVERNPALYDDPVESMERNLVTQVLASYKVNPRTVLFVGYSDTSLAEGRDDLERNDRTFFLKVGYAWVL